MSKTTPRNRPWDVFITRHPHGDERPASGHETADVAADIVDPHLRQARRSPRRRLYQPHEVNGPRFSHAMLTTEELLALLPAAIDRGPAQRLFASQTA